MTDDCRDFYDDLKSGSVTSFTHYYQQKQKCLEQKSLNPFYGFLYLCEDIYVNSKKDIQTGAFLGRRIIRTFYSLELSSSKLSEFLDIFLHQYPDLKSYCWSLRAKFNQVSDPEKSFFRSLNEYGVKYARTHRKLETYASDHLKFIEDNLKIDSTSTENQQERLLIDGINYSVSAGGKRLRPLLLFMVGDLYQLTANSLIPLARAVEYLHTSSLIFDDLPAQDNANLRRGRATLHTFVDNEVPNTLAEGRAQLVAVDLISHAITLVNTDLVKKGFSVERINSVVNVLSKSMHELCTGQMMDLFAARSRINIDSRTNDILAILDNIAWLKTGKAIEVVLVCPAILAGVSDTKEIDRIRELGRLLGILFQMKDDLLDVEGESIGKTQLIDQRNHTVTYVSVLGQDGTKERLKVFEKEAKQLVDVLWSNAGTIKDVIRYFIERKK